MSRFIYWLLMLIFILLKFVLICIDKDRIFWFVLNCHFRRMDFFLFYLRLLFLRFLLTKFLKIFLFDYLINLSLWFFILFIMFVFIFLQVSKIVSETRKNLLKRLMLFQIIMYFFVLFILFLFLLKILFIRMDWTILDVKICCHS